jgi:ribosomal protein S18 acetylase RimI-like enzyme
MKIRRITPDDLAEIRELDCAAWAGLWPSGQSKLRTMVNLLSNWNDAPKGCFVAEHHKELLGYIFSHICGSLGYIGTFGVLPDHRGKGIGKRLLRSSMSHLASNGCSTIGLETRPENQYNIGLYLRHGFVPKYLTFVLEHPTLVSNRHAHGAIIDWNELDESGQDLLAKKLIATCNLVVPGLNYVPMALGRIETSEAKICIFGTIKNPLGFALVRTAPKFEKERFTDAFVEAMVVCPVSVLKFVEIVRTLEVLSHRWGKSTVVLPVTSNNWQIMESLMRNGYRIRRSMLRMLYLEKPVNHRCLNLNFWAM